MGKYANWVDYQALYPGGIKQEEFEQALPEAEVWLETLTAGRVQSAPQWARAQITTAACAAVTRIAQREAARGMGGVPLSSVKNGNYSEQYRAGEACDEAVRSAILRALAGTGLIGAL